MDVNIEVTEINANAEIQETVITCEVTFGNISVADVPIETISVNGVNVAPVNKNVDITVPPLPDNIVIDANYVHTDNNLTDELVAEIGKVEDKQNITDNALNTTSKTVIGAINEVRGLCLEIPIGLVFATKAALDLWLLTPENKASLKNSQNLLIIDIDTPDYWWDYAAQIYHELEGKLDLSGYLTAEQIALAYQPLKSVLELYVSQIEKDTWNGKQPTITPTADTTPVDTDKFVFRRLGIWFEVAYSDLKTALATVFQTKLTFSTDIEADKASTTKVTAIQYIYNFFGKLSTVNTWALLNTFTTGIKSALFQDLNGNTPFVAQNGGSIYHTTAWINTGTVSTSGVTVTGVGTAFTAAMVGYKIIVNNEERIITAYSSATSITVNSTFSQNYSGIGFGVYARFMYYNGGVYNINPINPSTYYNSVLNAGFNYIAGMFIDQVLFGN